MSHGQESREARMILALAEYLGVEIVAKKGDTESPIDDELYDRDHARVVYDFVVRKKP